MEAMVEGEELPPRPEAFGVSRFREWKASCDMIFVICVFRNVRSRPVCSGRLPSALESCIGGIGCLAGT